VLRPDSRALGFESAHGGGSSSRGAQVAHRRRRRGALAAARGAGRELAPLRPEARLSLQLHQGRLCALTGVCFSLGKWKGSWLDFISSFLVACLSISWLLSVSLLEEEGFHLPGIAWFWCDCPAICSFFFIFTQDSACHV
jgi:hypothetical protein